jgi:SAM-dependent methyltransferase
LIYIEAQKRRRKKFEVKMAKKLKTTGERAVPDDIRSPLEHILLLRYLFIYNHLQKKLSQGDVVLEVGSGAGYGMDILSQTCKKIIGLDVSEDAVAYASNHYGSDKCRFKHYDGINIPFENNSFDAVINLQVVEHVNEDIKFIGELHRVLKKGKKLYLTTPNKKLRLKPGQKPWNRFHVREYDSRELDRLLKNYFSDIAICGISATDEIHKFEMSRFKHGFLIGLALKLGVRKMTPEFLDAIIARAISKKRSNEAGLADFEAMKSRFRLEDFRIEKDKIDDSLDLFAIAVK